MRLTIVQRVLPSYRAPFFDRLRTRLGEDGGTLALVAGLPSPEEGIVEASSALGAVRVENRRLSSSLWWQRAVITAVRRTHPDAVVIEMNPRLLSNLPLLAWCRARQVPVVGWGAGKIDRERSALVDRVSDLALRVQLLGCRGVIGYGPAAADTFARLGPHGLKVGIAPNSTLNIDPGVTPRSNRTSCPTFVFVGRLVEQKRVDVLLEAAAILRDAGLDLHLLIVGDGPYADVLRERAGSDTAIEFMGYREPPVIRDLLKSAHALVLPGRGGLVVQEALACALPVVVGPPAVAGDGTVHRLLDGSPAAIVAAEPTAVAFADAMRRIVDVETWPTRSAAAIELAARHGGLDAMADAFIGLLAKVR